PLILHHAYHGVPVSRPPDEDPPAHRLSLLEVARRQVSIDNRDWRGSPTIGRGDPAPGVHGESQHAERVRADEVMRREYCPPRDADTVYRARTTISRDPVDHPEPHQRAGARDAHR